MIPRYSANSTIHRSCCNTAILGRSRATRPSHSLGGTLGQTRVGTARYAASACCWPAVQCQGRSSCSRICSISAMRARTPASQTWGSMSLSLALPIRDYNTAALVAAAIGASEQPGFASETDAAQRSLRSIVREANAAVMLSTPAQTRVKHCHSNELAHLLRPGTCIVVPPHSKTLIANSRNRSVSPFHRELVRQLSIAAAGQIGRASCRERV